MPFSTSHHQHPFDHNIWFYCMERKNAMVGRRYLRYTRKQYYVALTYYAASVCQRQHIIKRMMLMLMLEWRWWQWCRWWEWFLRKYCVEKFRFIPADHWPIIPTNRIPLRRTILYGCFGSKYYRIRSLSFTLSASKSLEYIKIPFVVSIIFHYLYWESNYLVLVAMAHSRP